MSNINTLRNDFKHALFTNPFKGHSNKTMESKEQTCNRTQCSTYKPNEHDKLDKQSRNMKVKVKETVGARCQYKQKADSSRHAHKKESNHGLNKQTEIVFAIQAVKHIYSIRHMVITINIIPRKRISSITHLSLHAQ